MLKMFLKLIYVESISSLFVEWWPLSILYDTYLLTYFESRKLFGPKQENNQQVLLEKNMHKQTCQTA